MKFTDKFQYLRYLVDKRGMKPVYLIVGLTYDCNSFCRTCFNWEQLRKHKEQELSLEELQKTFATMGDLLFVVMSGGEPFLRRDLPEVCETLSTKNHVKQITIPTGAIASDLIARSVESTLQKCPETQIVVVSPIVRPDAETTANRLGASLEDIRGAIETVTRDHVGSGDLHLELVPGRHLVHESQLGDGIHPNDDGHRALAEAIGPVLEKVMG